MIRILIAVPCRDMIDVDFVKCITKLQDVMYMHKETQVDVEYLPGTIISMSRNKLSLKAIDEKYDYLFFVDSDMVFNSDILIDLLECKKDIVTGLCFMRKEPYEPCVYKKLRMGMTQEESIAEKYLDYPEDIFEIDACGCAAMLIKVDVLKDVYEKEKDLFFPYPGYGEDITFCIRARKNGYQIFCNPKTFIGHIGKAYISKETYETVRKRS